MSGGFDRFVFAVYRECIGLALLAPLAFVSERHVWNAFTLPVCSYITALGVVGIYVQQTLFLSGLSYTNTAFAAAMQNAIPVFTFLIAVIGRFEVIRISKIDGVAKLMGILACITGAITMSLFKGSVLIGSVCLLLSCFCMGAYTNLQIPALKRFPAPVSITAGSIFVGTVALVITSFLTVSDASKWVLNRPGNIVSVLYAGFVASGVNFTLQTWANQRGGPILVAAYIPLQTVFSVFLGLVVLDDPLYLGSVIGAVFILAGLYLVVWGQQAHQLAEKREALALSFLAEDVLKPLLSQALKT